MHLIMQTQTYLTPIDLDYHDGLRYPVMVRVEGTKDYLDEITEPLVKPATKSAQPGSALSEPARLSSRPKHDTSHRHAHVESSFPSFRE